MTVIVSPKKTSDWRYFDERPRIGIRPVLEGRMGGVREGLEERTMRMAVNAAELISNNINYIDGLPVECVVADSCICGIAEAAATQAKFNKNNVQITITVTACWAYGSETMDMSVDTIKAIWGFNGTERPGAVYLAATLAGYAQKGLPVFSIYGQDVQDADDESIPDDVQLKLLQFARSALAVATMRGKSYLSIGSVSMGIAGSMIDEEFFQNYLGMRNEYTDMSELDRRIQEGIYDEEEYQQAKEWVRDNIIIGEDINTEQSKTAEEYLADIDESIKMTIITKDLMIGNNKLADKGFFEESLGHNAIVSGFQGQRHWTDYRSTGDFMETIMNSSFDWTGTRQPYIVATENDSLNGVSMLFGTLLTQQAQIFSDVRTYWSPEAVKRVTGYNLVGKAENGFIHMINSGSSCLDGTGEQVDHGSPAIKPFWNVTKEDTCACIKAAKFCPADRALFKGGGFSVDYTTKGGMPMTMYRINLVQGKFPVLQLAEGWSIELPEEVHNTIDCRTSPTWPTTWFAPRLSGEGNFTSVYQVMTNWGANHAAISFGHIGSELLTLASMLRIPVSMHNVNREKIYRPDTWKLFGMNKEGADYRACESFGPLYK